MKLIFIIFLLLTGSAHGAFSCADPYESRIVEIPNPDFPGVRFVGLSSLTVFSVREVNGLWQSRINDYVLYDGFETEQEAEDSLREFVETLF